MAPNPVTNVTIKTGKGERFAIEVLDQTNDFMDMTDNTMSWIVSNPSILRVDYQTIEDIRLFGLAPGACTVTFNYKGISKVLNVTIVNATPTNINIIPHEA